MLSFILVLGVCLGALSILNKVLLLQKRPSGWITGMAIGLISGFYFYLVGLSILAAAELGFFIVMLFGLWNEQRQKDGKRIRSVKHINWILSFGLVILSLYLFTGSLTLWQLISALSFLWGGFALAERSKPSIGWGLFLLAHVTTMISAYSVGQVAFAVLQVGSALVCVYALISAETNSSFKASEH